MMCSVVENRGLEMVRESKYEIASILLRQGDALEKVAEATRLPIEKIEELASKLKPVDAG